MNYKFKVLKQTTELSELTVTVTAASYQEAIAKFNRNLTKVEESDRFKVKESTTVFCVDEWFTLEPVFTNKHNSEPLPDNVIPSVVGLLYENEEYWKNCTDENGWWIKLPIHDDMYEVNVWFVDVEGSYYCGVYPLLDNEPDPFVYFTYRIVESKV